MCGFLKFKQMFIEGQLPPAQDGSLASESGRIKPNIYDRCVLRVQLDCS